MGAAVDLVKRTEERFLQELRHHFDGWKTKVTTDLGQAHFEEELADLRKDPVYASFGLDTAEYALVRLMGRVSISIGRRLGEIYDKIPRFVTQARFNLSQEDVAPIMAAKLQLDVCVPLTKIAEHDKEHVQTVAKKHLGVTALNQGLAIEVRYNFNPNDSARLRKDVDMAEYVQKAGYTGVFLVFSTISPRDEAIARLTRAGWKFLVGDEATKFMQDLIGMDIGGILNAPAVREEVRREMATIMRALYESHAVRQALAGYPR